MSYIKKINVKYNNIETNDNNYFYIFQQNMDKIYKTNEQSEYFTINGINFLWKINNIINIDGQTYFISLVKGSMKWPVWFNNIGDIEKIPLHDGEIGEIFYALINIDKKIITSISAGYGSSVNVFTNLLNQFTKDQPSYLTPILKKNTLSTVKKWDYFKKIAFTLKFCTSDNFIDFKTTQTGKLIDIVNNLESMKNKVILQGNVLNKLQTEHLINNLLMDANCLDLIVKGGKFDDNNIEEYNLKNSTYNYSCTIDIEGNFLNGSEAYDILYTAYTRLLSENN